MIGTLNILVVDDEPNMRRVLQILLERLGHTVVLADDGAAALERLAADSVDLIISDLRMPRLDGLGLQRALREQGLQIPLIMISAHGSVDTAVSAMKGGAVDFLQRPFDRDTLELAIQRVVQQGWLIRQNRYLREAAGIAQQGLVGDSAQMATVRRAIEQVGPTAAGVLLTGETGTGKTLLAHHIHARGPRKDKLFIEQNCGTLPEALLESELFGHKRGAFTGAVQDRKGLFETVDGGTLLLDEVS